MSNKVAIVTVHGTGDTAPGPDGEKWFQRGSRFTERLKQDLSQQGLSADILPHLWTGANSASARERAADKLADLLRGLFNRYDTIHVVGHSHGGNVANDAAVLLKWGLRSKQAHEKLDSLITVGTPFFDVRTGWFQKLAGLLFMAITWASVIAFAIIAVYALSVDLATPIVQAASTQQPLYLHWDLSANVEQGARGVGIPGWSMVYVVVIGLCLAFMMRMSVQGVRRILRPRTGGRTKTALFSIWHDNDEAIAFLQRVEELPIDAFPRGSLMRGSRTAAIGFGVLAVLALALVNPVLFALGQADIFEYAVRNADEGVSGNVVAVTLLSLLAAPAVFVLIYLLYHYGVGGVQEVGVRGSMNRFVSGVLRGVAMGRDGDQVLCSVAPRSHTHTTEEYVLTGECAMRMRDGAQGAAGALIEKYRWALFSVGGDSSASLTSLTTDAMTWDSLIHTTYFDQPEVSHVIAAYIAAKAKNETFTPPSLAPAPSLEIRPKAEPEAAPSAEGDAPRAAEA